jgi:hypothetical protein
MVNDTQMRQTLIDYSNKYGPWQKYYNTLIKNIFTNMSILWSSEKWLSLNYTLISHITADCSTLNHHHNHNHHVVFLTKEYSKECGLVLPLSYSCTFWLPWRNIVTAYFLFLFFPLLLFFFLSILLLTIPSCVHSHMHHFIQSLVYLAGPQPLPSEVVTEGALLLSLIICITFSISLRSSSKCLVYFVAFPSLLSFPE